MTKIQVRLLRQVLRRLDTSDPRCGAAPDVREAFDGPARVYLRTWVLPLLQDLIDSGTGEIDSRTLTRIYGRGL